MHLKKILLLSVIFIIISGSSIQGIAEEEISTTLEIIDIRGGIGGVNAEIKNTGDEDAGRYIIIITWL